MSLTKEESDKLFDAFDQDKNGTLTQKELILCVGGFLGASVKSAEIQNWMHKFDTDGDGHVTRDEFHARLIKMSDKKPERIEALKMAASKRANPPNEALAKSECIEVAIQCFTALDKEKNGYLGTAQVEVIMGAIRPGCDMGKVFSNWDKDGDGQVSESEFTQRVDEMAQMLFNRENNFDKAHAYDKLKTTMEKALSPFLAQQEPVTSPSLSKNGSAPPTKRGCECVIS